MKILVVDDEECNREICSGIIKRFGGHEVMCAKDGYEAMETLRQNADIDLVVSDIDMPRLDGFGLMEEMTKLGHKARRLIMTGLLHEERVVRGKQLGAERVFKKFDFMDVFKELGIIVTKM